MLALIQCGGRLHRFSASPIAATGDPTTTPPLPGFERTDEPEARGKGFIRAPEGPVDGLHVKDDCSNRHEGDSWRKEDAGEERESEGGRPGATVERSRRRGRRVDGERSQCPSDALLSPETHALAALSPPTLPHRNRPATHPLLPCPAPLPPLLIPIPCCVPPAPPPPPAGLFGSNSCVFLGGGRRISGSPRRPSPAGGTAAAGGA